MNIAAGSVGTPATRGRHSKFCLVVSALLTLSVPVAALAEPPPVLDCSYAFCCNDYSAAVTSALDGTVHMAGYVSVGFYFWTHRVLHCDDWVYTGNLDTYPARTWPSGIAVDDSGRVFISRFDNNTVSILSDPPVVWGGTGTAPGQFDLLGGIAIDGPHLFAADRRNHRVQKLLLDGTPVTSFGTYGNDPGELGQPVAVAVDRAGHVYVADYENHRVQKYTTDGTFVTEWGARGSGPGEFVRPVGISADGDGGVFVADSARIQKFSDTGAFSTSWVVSFDGYPSPLDVAADGQGGVYVVTGWDLIKYREVDVAGVGSSPSSTQGLTIENLSPNPFRDRIQLSWTQPTAGPTDISLADVSGRRVATLASGTWSAGRQQVSWSTSAGSRDLAAGVYWVRVRSQGREVAKPVVFVR